MVTSEEIKLICRLDENWTPKTIEAKEMGGETNKNYLVRDEKGLWCVRLPLRGDTHDREAEPQNIKALIKHKELSGILPNYRLYLLGGENILLPEPEEEINLPDGTTIVEYIEGEDLDADLLKQEEVQELLVKTLHRFHASGVKFVNCYDPFEDEVSKYKRELESFPVRELVGSEVIARMEEIENVMRDRLPLGEGISTHNDLILDNLRLGKDGRVYLLDFEYAGVNTRGLYYDFGTLLGENLFLKKPLGVEVYREVMDRASVIYERAFDLSILYCGATVDVMVTFWWRLLEYLKAEREGDEKRKRYFKRYFPKRIKKIDFLSGL